MNCYPFIEAEKAQRRNVKRACELLKVSRSAYYAARGDGPSQRAAQDAELAERVKAVHEESKGRYGSPRVHAQLQAVGAGVTHLKPGDAVFGFAQGTLATETTVSVDFVAHVPDGISMECPSQTEIIVKGSDRQKVGQVAAEIRHFRPPEPYKGKGVRYAGEQITLKETKKK